MMKTYDDKNSKAIATALTTLSFNISGTLHQIDHQVETLLTPNFFALNQSYAIVNTIYVAKENSTKC